MNERPLSIGVFNFCPELFRTTSDSHALGWLHDKQAISIEQPLSIDFIDFGLELSVSGGNCIAKLVIVSVAKPQSAVGFGRPAGY